MGRRWMSASDTRRWLMISQQTVSTEHINGSEFTEDCGQLRAQRSCPSKQGLQSTSLPRPPLPLGTLGIVSLLIYEKMIVMSVSDIHSYVAKYNIHPRPSVPRGGMGATPHSRFDLNIKNIERSWWKHAARLQNPATHWCLPATISFHSPMQTKIVSLWDRTPSFALLQADDSLLWHQMKEARTKNVDYFPTYFLRCAFALRIGAWICLDHNGQGWLPDLKILESKIDARIAILSAAVHSHSPTAISPLLPRVLW